MDASRRVDGIQVARDDDGRMPLAQIFDHLLDASQPFVVVVTIDRHARSVRPGSRSVQAFRRGRRDARTLSTCL